MLTLLTIVLLVVCLMFIGVTVLLGLVLGSGIIFILIPIVLDILITVMIIKVIFRRKKAKKNKK